MAGIVRLAAQVAASEASILITGESGTGKEMVARFVHEKSARANKPFVSVNCAAIPENLLESELFGHEKGAFTGAVARRIGKFEEADGGTLLLDEISEMEVRLQAKLLRALQERVIDRVGGTRPVPVNIRVVATSNRDLLAEVREGRFREDLLYRLNVIRLHLPPLRERSDDIPLLARHFLALHCRQLNRELEGFSPAALALLNAHPFPGNIRELSNVVEQAVALAGGPLIEVHDLPERLHRPQPPSPPRAVTASAPPAAAATPLEDAIGSLEQEQIREALRLTGWNISQSAVRLGISRNTLRYRIEKYGLRP
jgi:DNA-binding NtrC family response regulator